MIPVGHILRSINNLLLRRLRFPKGYLGSTIKMDDGKEFKIFRHMKLIATHDNDDKGSILVVRFKFRKGNHASNIRKSRIPILMIAGFPGFCDKMWMIDHSTGFWQGVYQWMDDDTIERYKKSFVLGLMNKRSIEETLSFETVSSMNIDDFIRSKMLEDKEH